jgi:phosphocarrier protein HPr
MAVDNVVTRKAVVSGGSGLNGRPATLLAAVAGQFRADVMLKYGEDMVNVKSMLGLMSLGIQQGAVVTILAQGDDAKEAVSMIELMLQQPAPTGCGAS